MFGKPEVRIQWVTNMGAHLDFDPANPLLSLYQFPTPCALKCMLNQDNTPTVLRRYAGLDAYPSYLALLTLNSPQHLRRL
jgi:hypothetical protein